MTYGLEHYEYRQVFEKEQTFPGIPVQGGRCEEMLGTLPRAEVGFNIPEEEQSLRLLLKEGEQVRIETDLPQALTAPVEAGDYVGSVKYYLEDELAAEYPVCALESIKKIDFNWCFDIIKKDTCVLPEDERRRTVRRRKRMKQYIMALDQGTTSSRCIIFDKEGKICSMVQKEFEQIFPQPGWVEHNPVTIWSSQLSAAMEAMSELRLTAKEIAAIGITNQRETTVIWGESHGAAGL